MSMNKINIDGVLIVEGKADVCYLSSFVNSLFFTTNGYDLSEEKIEFLKRASKVTKLIIYTDPDDAGGEIRKKLKTLINHIFEAKSEKVYRKKQKKFGVAELDKDEVVRSLTPYVTSTTFTPIKYELNKLISISNNPSENHMLLINKYRLIDGNNKSLENQLNILKIDPKEVEELLSGN